ncbi:YdeI/OmpD-associated family protein [Mucilaginibacter antarcticus]|uniref:YdeI family protein n=1 Tax=Mucilaginibacter antarcticus TaxID=1855725 RepID=A0ABW5XNB0_9SPHI
MQTDTETFYPKNRREWRKWLEKNHATKQSVWVVMYKKASEKPSISWTDAVDEAICFGWIDSLKKSVDSESSVQFFSRRKPKSAWSKINKDKVEKLTNEGLITPAGQTTIDIAKQNGSWALLDEVELLVIPDDLQAAFKRHPGSRDFFMSLSKSIKKMMLQWVAFAKLPETRENRINEIAELAGLGKKPKQF